MSSRVGVSLCNHNRPDRLGNPDGNTIRTMRSKGIRVLSDLGVWRREETGELTFNVDWSPRRKGRWTPTQSDNWDKFAESLQSFPACWLFDGPEDLLAARKDRQQWAEACIRELSVSTALKPSQTAGSAQIWGTDGSMLSVPASASLCDSARGGVSLRRLQDLQHLLSSSEVAICQSYTVMRVVSAASWERGKG
ncbi:hypothetical protein R3P38DRAFT_3191417 [Favolaschia claudopus]|uniref:Uncharacterized protein n=1 Tax=Favolaschia claudopus TaxID=2862362 RepID=A0AAW0BLD4_9AGAR